MTKLMTQGSWSGRSIFMFLPYKVIECMIGQPPRNTTHGMVSLNTTLLQLCKRDKMCVRCGCKPELAAFFKQGDGTKPHIGIYADKGSHYTSMNIDHIKPKAKGGLDCYDNLQLMCEECNVLKGKKENDSFIASYKSLMNEDSFIPEKRKTVLLKIKESIKKVIDIWADRD